MAAVTVEVAGEVTPDLVAAFERLVPQLSRSSPPPDAGTLAAVVANPSNTVFIARSGDGTIVGTLTLVVFRIPTGARAWIEDVVVDESARAQGAASALTNAALARAAELGVRTVDLTSRPSREDANRLYQKLGFVKRETNVYRYDVPG